MTQSQESTVKPLFGFRALMADLADWIREHRMTLGFVLFITLFNVGMQLVCGIRHTQFPPQLSRVSFDALAHGRWYTAPISLLSVPQLGRLLIDIPLILIAFGLCETVIGKAKTAWVSLITTLGGIALGMGLCSLFAGKSPQWHAISHDGAILGPLVVVVGTLMCASAFTAMLWRRRIRVIGYSVVLILFLYRGEAGDYCLLASALLGHVLGYLMASESQGDVYRHGALYEMRRLIGMAAGVQAVGSLVAVSSRQSFGLLSMFGLLTGSTEFDTEQVLDCLNGFLACQLFRAISYDAIHHARKLAGVVDADADAAVDRMGSVSRTSYCRSVERAVQCVHSGACDAVLCGASAAICWRFAG